jgi:tetratricopeptide (TPR) repeat protein/TolB-like protein
MKSARSCRVWIFLAAITAAFSCAPERDVFPVSPSVVLGPFEVAGEEGGNEFVSRAFGEAVATNLEEVVGLRVLEAPPTSDGEVLLLSGRIERQGQDLRLSSRLTDAGTGEAIETFDLYSRSGDLSQLAVCLARRTSAVLGAASQEPYIFLGNVVCSEDDPDDRLILDVVEAWRRGDRSALLARSTALVRRKPDSLVAHALSAAALAQAWDAAPTQETMDELKRRFEEMNRLDPANPFTDLFLAYAYRSSGEPRRAREIYDSLLARDDMSPAMRAWVERQRSYALLQTGDAIGARRAAEAGVRLDPVSASGFFALSRTLEALGELDEAARSAERALALEPLAWRHEQRLGLVLVRLGRNDEAVGHFDRACELSGRQDACANRAVAILRAGLRERASEAARYARTLPESSWGLYNLACYHALAGDSDAALLSLQRALDQGFADYLIATDSDLDSLRGLPEFEVIVKEATLRSARRKEITINAFPLQ